MITICYQIVILLFYISLATSARAKAPTHLLITRAGPCNAAVRTLITVSELKLSTQRYDSLLSGEFNVSEDIENGWKVKATMQKCVDIRNMDSCDFFRSFYLVHDGCRDKDEDEQETYNNMLFHYAHPKLDCPIKAGRYKLIDYPLFTEDNYLVVPESKISTSVFGYTFRLDGLTEERRKIFCVEALLQLVYTRRHNWVDKTHIKNIIDTTLSTPVSSGINTRAIAGRSVACFIACTALTAWTCRLLLHGEQDALLNAQESIKMSTKTH